MEPQLFFLHINLNMGGQSGMDLPTTVSKVKTLLGGYSSSAKCIHMFKITGESKVIAVYEVTNVISLERIVSGLARMDNIDVLCKPLLQYQKFAAMLGVDEKLTKPSTNCIDTAKQLFWLDFTVEYPGKTTDQLLATWKNEAMAALGARAGPIPLEAFKLVAERKVYVFIVITPEELDKLSFNLPVMTENGNGVTVINKAIHNLEDYCKEIAKEN